MWTWNYTRSVAVRRKYAGISPRTFLLSRRIYRDQLRRSFLLRARCVSFRQTSTETRTSTGRKTRRCGATWEILVRYRARARAWTAVSWLPISPPAVHWIELCTLQRALQCLTNGNATGQSIAVFSRWQTALRLSSDKTARWAFLDSSCREFTGFPLSRAWEKERDGQTKQFRGRKSCRQILCVVAATCCNIWVTTCVKISLDLPQLLLHSHEIPPIREKDFNLFPESGTWLQPTLGKM